jgi:hypothetical protein
LSKFGVGNVEHVLEQSRWADEPIPPTVDLLDGDDIGEQVLDKIVSQSGVRSKLIERAFVATVAERAKPLGGNKIVTSHETLSLSSGKNGLLPI